MWDCFFLCAEFTCPFMPHVLLSRLRDSVSLRCGERKGRNERYK